MKHKWLTRAWFVVAAVLAMAMFLPACGGDDPEQTTAPPATTTAVVPMEFRVNLAGEPAMIDPNRASWSAERSVINQVFEGLLGFNQDLSLKPVVAEAIPTTANAGISADGKTYTFKVKSAVVWSDNTKVTANDFVYSIKRMLNPDLACEYASFYFGIVGAEAYFSSGSKTAAEKTALAAAVGVRAVDAATLEIKLINASPSFLNLMALWPTYPVKESVITANGEGWTEAGKYLGNGPFILKEWVHQDHMTFERNPNYWGTKPKLTKITYKMITDANAALNAYKNNELDISGVPVGTEAATMVDAVLSKEIVRYPELVTFAFQFNVNKAPFNNVKVRQALNCAVDRATFVTNVRGGVGKPALSWIPPGMPGYDANLGAEYAFNVTKAKQLLADAGYADITKLPQLKFQFSDTAGNRTIAQFLQAQLKQNLNIDLVLEPMESKAFSQMVNSEQHTWAWFGWGADYPDPDNWLPQLFGTKAGNNHTGYSNAAFDALCTQALKELDTTKRLALWAQAAKMVNDDVPIVTMFYRERFVLVKPSVKGLKTTGMDGQVAGDMFYAEVSIQK
jgi:oligopeptide transport system substrate-binding protein